MTLRATARGSHLTPGMSGRYWRSPPHLSTRASSTKRGEILHAADCQTLRQIFRNLNIGSRTELARIVVQQNTTNPAGPAASTVKPARSLAGYSWLVRKVRGDTPRVVRDL